MGKELHANTIQKKWANGSEKVPNLRLWFFFRELATHLSSFGKLDEAFTFQFSLHRLLIPRPLPAAVFRPALPSLQFSFHRRSP